MRATLVSFNPTQAATDAGIDTGKAVRYFIYALCDPRDGAIRYVGITRQPVQKRLNSHLREARQGKQLHSSRWLQQLLQQNKRPQIVVLEETTNHQREAFWIQRLHREGCQLTNLTSGGISNYCHSLETRQKISQAGQTRFKDLAGQTIGRLTVLEVAHHKPVRWRCLCSCGQVVLILAQSFSAGRVQSCGCLNRELSAQRTRARARHGMWQSKEYLTWIEMRARCNNPNHSRYDSNGALGVQVCPEWQASFESFLADMGPKPENLVLMRRDVTQNYDPTNCVWATKSELRKQKR